MKQPQGVLVVAGGGSGGTKKGKCKDTPKEQFKTMQKTHAVWKSGALADVGVHSNSFQQILLRSYFVERSVLVPCSDV